MRSMHTTMGGVLPVTCVAFVTATIMLISACDDSQLPTAGDAPSPEFSISDGAHSSGNVDFFFLPPLVRDPSGHPEFDADGFDATQSPEVEICVLDGDGCGSILVTYTMNTGSGSERLRVSEADEHYVVNWHTERFDLDQNEVYRIRVLVEDNELGYADVVVVSSGRRLRRVDRGQYVGLRNGRTLPIKFRIEEGALQQQEGIFTIAGPDDLAGLDTGVVTEPAIVDRHFVLVDLERFAPSQEQVLFNLSDAVFVASRDKVHLRSPNDYTWFGVVEGEPYSRVSLTERNSVLVGNLRLPGVIYSVRYVGGQVHSVLEVDPSRIPPDAPAIGDPQPLPQGSQSYGVSPALMEAVSQEALSQSQFSDSIDVMVLYTADALIAEGGFPGIEGVIVNAIAETNDAYELSLVEQRLRLVHTARVDYDETGDSELDIACLYWTDDRCLDDIHSLRDSHGADIVSLVVKDLEVGGAAHGLEELWGDRSNLAFSVVKNLAMRTYTFAHELGHNMGCAHNRADARLSDGVFDYSYGYQDPDWLFRTIMAYDCGNDPDREDCPRVPYFSNPDVLVDGRPTGVDRVADLPNSAECAQTLNETYAIVGNWRWPPVPGAQIQGVVINTLGEPITDAVITVDNTNLQVTPNADGLYVLDGLPAGDYVIRVSIGAWTHPGKAVSVRPLGPPQTVNFVVLPVPTSGPVGRIEGVVVTGDGARVGDAIISVVGTNLSTVTNADGSYSLQYVPTGPQHVTASLPGSGRQQEKTVWVEEGIAKTVDFVFGQVVLTAGYSHTCGLIGTGAAYCWGLGSAGRLGNGGWGSRDEPTAVIGGHTFIALSLGGSHSCGLDVRGMTYCWGSNVHGQLGDATQTNKPVPTAVSGGHTFVALAAGRDHTCGVDGTGAAYCWGSNSNGQLGDGTYDSHSVPQGVAGGEYTFVALTAGIRHTCGLDIAGAAYCWGDNEAGQVGHDWPADHLLPFPVSGGHTFAVLAAGNVHTCGVDTEAAAFCWGRNEYGQLGDGTQTNKPVPTAVSGLGLVFGVLTAGGGHTCGLDARFPWVSYCWGYNENGQLGDGTQSNKSVPTAVTGGKTFASLTAGSRHTCGVGMGDRAFCWGDNASGQLGDGTNAGRLIPTPVVSWPPP